MISRIYHETSQKVNKLCYKLKVDELLEAHVEGGPSWRGWELLAFGDVLRDLDRGLQEVKTGYAVEMPELSFGAWQGKAGVGNAARSREAVAAATGLESADLEAAVVSGGASVHWYGYLNMYHPEWDVDVSFKALPKIDFSDAEFTGNACHALRSWQRL